jgi:dTDP-4-amino-4,6-dideoxygalactose transaminase
MYSQWPSYDQKTIKEISKIIKSGNLNIWKGKNNLKFEKNYAKFINRKYALSIANGSVALEIALKSIGIKKNDEIIVTSKSYFISAACVLNVGAIPKFVDVDYETQNISYEEIKKNISNKTKAIICVHLGGLPCDIKKIIKLGKKNKLFIIEDCAQAHGAKIGNQIVGSFGDIACWSFCNDKIISSGEGGMIVTNNYNIWKKAWSLREGGRSLDAIKNQKNIVGFKYIHDYLGTNSRMTEIQATICDIQLKHLNKNLRIRNRNANLLRKLLEKYDFIDIPKLNEKIKNSYYRLYVKFNNQLIKNKKLNRDILLKLLLEKKIPCEEGSCSEIYLEKPFSSLKIKRKTNAKKLSTNSIAFLVHHKLKKNEMYEILKDIKIVLDNIDK